MPKYTRKTDGPSRHSRSKLKKAHKAIMNGRSVARVANTYKMSRSSLAAYKKRWEAAGTTIACKSLHGSRVLTDEEETAFVEVLKEFQLFKIPVTHNDAQRLCYAFAEKVGSTKIAKWAKTKKASYDWMAGFLRRNKSAAKIIRHNYKGYQDPIATPSLSKDDDVVPASAHPETLARQIDILSHSNAEKVSNGSGSESSSIKSGSESKSSDTDSSDESNVSDTQDTRQGFLVSTKMDKPVVFRGSLPATSSRKSKRVAKNYPFNITKNLDSDELNESIDEENGEQPPSTSVQEEPETAPSSTTSNPISERIKKRNTELQTFEEELDKFVKELKRNGIEPSDADISLIRQKCLEQLNLGNEPNQDKLQQQQKGKGTERKKGHVPRTNDLFASKRALFANLYEQNLRNNVKEGITVKNDEGLNTDILKTTRNFDEYEFVTEIQGITLDSDEGSQRSLQHAYVNGEKQGRLFYLGATEQMKWIDCSEDIFARAIQDSDDPNLLLQLRKVSVGSQIAPKLFFVAKRPLEEGETLTYDFNKVHLRNAKEIPFIRV